MAALPANLYMLATRGFLALNIAVIFVESKIIEGELRTDENWIFLTRFCFLSKYGTIVFDVSYPKEYATQNILLYFDEKNQWAAVYKQKKTCVEKEAVLSIPNGQVIALNETTSGSGCFSEKISDEETIIQCNNKRIFYSVRERWWFIAVSNCYSNQGLMMKYRITMVNDPDNFWFKHFTAGEFYILQVDIAALVVYVILLLTSLYAAHKLRAKHHLHKTYVLYLASVFFESAGLGFLCTAYALYAENGKEFPVIKLIGKGLESISTLLLLLLLILIAKGYTITRGRLKSITYLKIASVMTVYAIAYVLLFFYQKMYFDPAEVLHIYDSPYTYILIGLRIFGWSWFLIATVFTVLHYPEKSRFYSTLFIFYSLWFFSTPVMYISTFQVQKTLKETVINGIELFVIFYGHFIFLLLTRPSLANGIFPYHVRTTQIDIMNNNRIAGQNPLDRFPHYPHVVPTTGLQKLKPAEEPSLEKAEPSSTDDRPKTEQVRVSVIAVRPKNKQDESSTTDVPLNIGQDKVLDADNLHTSEQAEISALDIPPNIEQAELSALNDPPNIEHAELPTTDVPSNTEQAELLDTDASPNRPNSQPLMFPRTCRTPTTDVPPNTEQEQLPVTDAPSNRPNSHH